MNNELLSAISDLLDNKLDLKLEPVNTKLDSIGTQVKENTAMIKALRHSSEINKATLDKISLDVAYIKGDVEKIKKDLSVVEKVTAKNWTDINELKEAK